MSSSQAFYPADTRRAEPEPESSRARRTIAGSRAMTVRYDRTAGSGCLRHCSHSCSARLLMPYDVAKRACDMWTLSRLDVDGLRPYLLQRGPLTQFMSKHVFEASDEALSQRCSLGFLR